MNHTAERPSNDPTSSTSKPAPSAHANSLSVSAQKGSCSATQSAEKVQPSGAHGSVGAVCASVSASRVCVGRRGARDEGKGRKSGVRI